MHSFTRNKNNSPLLALPSEIRTKILQKVMGGNNVHILPQPDRKYQAFVCLSPEDYPDHESPRVTIASDDNNFNYELGSSQCFTTRHKSCSTPISNAITARNGLNLDLLRVCRQLYQEAAFLPFQQNNFVLGLHAPLDGRPPAMDRFINRLCRDQREQVQHITVISDTYRIKDRYQLARLKGLRSLSFIFAPVPRDSPHDLYKSIDDLWMSPLRCPVSWPLLESVRISIEVYLGDKECAALGKQGSKLDYLVRKAETKTLYLDTGNANVKAALKQMAGNLGPSDLSRCFFKLRQDYIKRRSNL